MSCKIGIIDIFGKYKSVPVCDVKYSYSHGKVSFSILQTLVPKGKAEFIKYNAKGCKDNANHVELKSLLKQLKKININENEQLDYLNISAFSYFPVKQFGENGKLLAEPKIRNQILSNIMDERLSIPLQVKHILEELDRIIKDGTKVVVSAGNSQYNFNLFSLCKEILTIGGYDLKNKRNTQGTSNNPLVDAYVPLPLYVLVRTPNFIKENNLKTIKISHIFNLQHSFAKLSKKELKKRVATVTEHEQLAQIIQGLHSTKKILKFDINFMTTSIQRFIPKNLQSKVYDVHVFQSIFNDKFDKEVLDSVVPCGTHCDLTYTQFFDLSCKGEKHVISQKKTTKVRQAMSGTTFCPIEYIANDIKKCQEKSFL